MDSTLIFSVFAYKRLKLLLVSHWTVQRLYRNIAKIKNLLKFVFFLRKIASGQ